MTRGGSRTNGVEAESDQSVFGCDPEMVAIHREIVGDSRKIAAPKRAEWRSVQAGVPDPPLSGEPEARPVKRKAPETAE